MAIIYTPLNINDETELRSAAYIHESTPQNWDAAYKVTDERILFWVDYLKNILTKEKSFVLLAKEGASVVGLHWLKMTEKFGKPCAYIESLWVHNDQRKSGIGSELKRQGEEWAKAQGATVITTSVHYTNKKMIDFNLKKGFEALQVEMIKSLK